MSSNLTPHAAERDDGVKGEDLGRYAKEVAALAKKLADALPSAGTEVGEQAVWEVYAGTEKLIAVLRFRIDYETPGVFTKLPRAEDAPTLLVDAGALLSKSEGEISARKLVDAVETLRGARNNLRSYLTEKRKATVKSNRASRGKPSS